MESSVVSTVEKKSLSGHRLLWIDSAKGIGILLVALGHMMPMGWPLTKWIFSFHMPFFFLISGICFSIKQSWRKKKFCTLLCQKGSSLGRPYLYYSLLSVLVLLMAEGPIRALKGVYNTIILNGISALWFIPALYLGELLFIWIHRSVEKGTKRLLLYGAIVFATVLFSRIDLLAERGFILKHLLTPANVINRGLIGAVFVAAGFYGYELYTACRTSCPRKCRFLFAAALILCAVVTAIVPQHNYVDLNFAILGNPLFFYVDALAGSYVVLYLSRVLLDRRTPISFYGENSIVILGTHLNLRIKKFVQERINPQDTKTLAAFLVLMAIETIFIFVHRRIEQFADQALERKCDRI